jgi:hypothetical protein
LSPLPYACLFSRRRLSLASALVFATAGSAHAATQVALPAYVFPNDPYLQSLIDPVQTPVPPSIVIVNLDNGDTDESSLDPVADQLRARIAANGQHVQVIGYVHTDNGQRATSDIDTSVDRYLTVRNGSIHYDGIFFDMVPNACGSTAGLTDFRDKLLLARQHVASDLGGAPGLVVNNVGTAVPDCFLQPGYVTADVFVTFEDTAAHYAVNASSVGWQYGWVGGNVIVSGSYSMGTEFPNTQFWHLIYNIGAADWQNALTLASQRNAGYVDITDAYMVGSNLNPWTASPSYLNAEIQAASSLTQ